VQECEGSSMTQKGTSHKAEGRTYPNGSYWFLTEVSTVSGAITAGPDEAAKRVGRDLCGQNLGRG